MPAFVRTVNHRCQSAQQSGLRTHLIPATDPKPSATVVGWWHRQRRANVLPRKTERESSMPPNDSTPFPFDVPGWAIGDALDLARQLPDDSIDCIVTSPPYWGLRSYLPDDHPDKAKEMGAEPTLAEYVAGMVGLFRELRRALKPDGTCWLNLGDSYSGSNGGGYSSENKARSARDAAVASGNTLGQRWSGVYTGTRNAEGLKSKDLCLVPYRVALALQADGWWLRDNIVWHKPNPMPASVTDRCTSAHEAVFLLTKSARYWFDQDAIREPLAGPLHAPGNVAAKGDAKRNDFGTERMGEVWGNPAGRNRRNVWTIATKPYRGSHYAVMPPALVEPCVKAGCPAGGIVLDPFGGSGTVAEVAESLGRRWLLFDIDQRNVDLMKKRTAQRSLLGLL